MLGMRIGFLQRHLGLLGLERLKSMRKCLQHRRLQWFDHLERTEESALSSNCKTVKVIGSILRGQPKKPGVKESKVSKDLSKCRNA